MTKTVRTRIYGAALTALVFGACNGHLKVSDEQSALDGGTEPDSGFSPDTGSTSETGPDTNSPEADTGTAPCPDSEPQGACKHESQMCVYGPKYCDCRDNGSFLNWVCVAPTSSAGCPEEAPTDGSPCGNRNDFCYYPPTSCYCPMNGDMNWACAEGAPPQPPHPTTVDGTKPINQLSDAEREAWCDWYLLAYQGPGLPDPPMSPLTPDGLATQTGCNNGGFTNDMCAAIIPELPPAYCKGNLALSTCAAPLSELSACVLAVVGDCWPSPTGCSSYLGQPGCAGTMAIKFADGADSGKGNCTVKVQ